MSSRSRSTSHVRGSSGLLLIPGRPLGLRRCFGRPSALLKNASQAAARPRGGPQGLPAVRQAAGWPAVTLCTERRSQAGQAARHLPCCCRRGSKGWRSASAAGPSPLDPRATRERSHDILRPLFRRSCAAWPLSHFCLSQAIAVFGEDGDGELAQLCARDAAQTALRLMGESTTPPVGGTPAPRRALGPSTPAASPSPAPSCLAGHERRGRGGGRRRLPPSASPHGRAHRCTRSRPSGRRGGRPTL